MEHLVKIINEERIANSKLWKYNFLDIQTNQEDYFHNNSRIDYIYNLNWKPKATNNWRTKISHW